MMVSNRNLLYKGSIFRFHVCFGGCAYSHLPGIIILAMPLGLKKTMENMEGFRIVGPKNMGFFITPFNMKVRFTWQLYMGITTQSIHGTGIVTY